MGADASIYSLIRQPQPIADPIQSYGNVLQLKSLMGQQGLQDLQRQQLEKGIADEAATADAYRQSGGDATKLRDLLYGKGLFKPAQAAEKSALEIKEKTGNIDKTAAETKLKKWELGDKIHSQNLQDLQGANDQGTWDRMRANIYERYVQQLGPDEAVKRVQAIPAVFDANTKQQLLVTGLKTKEFLEMMKPDIKEVTDGQRKFFVDTNPRSNPDITKMKVQLVASPDALLSAATTRRGQDKPVWDSDRGVFVQQPGAVGGGAPAGAPVAGNPAPAAAPVAAPAASNTAPGAPGVIAPAGLPAKPDQYGEPKEVTGSDGKPRLVMQNKKTGELVDANTKQPVSGVGPKAGEQAQKQLTGVQTTKSAITEYRDALKNWSASDIVNPNARARMGTVYNNMMLQAKEAYNLGVLNGPDYQILQEVITSPSSLQGGITSNAALDDQAKKLDEILTRIGSQVTETQSGITPSAAAKPAAPQFTRAQIDAELRRRGVIK